MLSAEMVWTDRFTEMVVGRALADQLDRACLEKMYEGAEEKLKQTTHVAYEPRLEIPNYNSEGNMFHPTQSLPLELPQDATLHPRCPKLQRSQSEIVETTRPTIASHSGPPDITAIDLSDDHFSRACSQTDIRAQRSTRMPPLGQMTGFGKYRRSVHADPEWQMQQYRANLRDFPGLVPHLGEFKLADPDPVVWGQFCQESARSNSFASSKTSHSSSSDCHNDGIIDPGTGPIVTRGFVPSTSSSAASSLRASSSGDAGKDSTLSMTSPSGDLDNKLFRFPGRQSTLSLLCEQTALMAIHEDLAGDQNHRRKASQYLKCDIKGAVENAVESDYENEAENSALQVDGAKRGNHATGPLTLRSRDVQSTKLAQRVTIERVKGRHLYIPKRGDSTNGLDRSTTVIRKPIKHALRRTVSRGKPPNSRRLVTSENGPITSKKVSSLVPKPQELAFHGLLSSDQSTDAHNSTDDQGLSMAGTKNSKLHPAKEMEGLIGSFKSDSTMHSVTIDMVPKNSANSARHPRRNRSGSATCIVSETLQA